MEWVQKRPRDPGFYWLNGSNREDGTCIDEIVFVYDSSVHMIGRADCLALSNLKGVWFGPIEPPQLPSAAGSCLTESLSMARLAYMD